MNKNIILLSKVDDYVISIKTDAVFDPYVKVGSKVKVGDNLYKVEGMKVEESHYLPDELEVKKEDTRNYLCRLESEYVTKGEAIAEKFMATGLASKRVLAGKDGILSFDRIDKGFIDILSEKEVRIHKSHLAGTVVSVDTHDHIDICPDMTKLIPYACKLSFATGAKAKEYNEFVIIKDGSSIYTPNDLVGDYTNKVVFAGQYLHPQLVKKLVDLGCRAIVTFSMDYEEFRNMQGSIIVLGGFGHLQMDKRFLGLMRDFEGSYACIDEKIGNALGIINSTFSWPFVSSQNAYSVPKVGDDVTSVDLSNFKQIGKIDSFEQDGEYALVDFGKAGRSLIKVDNLRNIVNISNR